MTTISSQYHRYHHNIIDIINPFHKMPVIYESDIMSVIWLPAHIILSHRIQSQETVYNKALTPLSASMTAGIYQFTLSRTLASANHSTILSATHSGDSRKVRYVNRKSSTYFVSTEEWSSTKCRTSFSGVPYITEWAKALTCAQFCPLHLRWTNGPINYYYYYTHTTV